MGEILCVGMELDMKNLLSKKIIIATAVVLLALMTAGISLAYVYMKTEPKQNNFTPANVSCAVVENGAESVGDIVEVREEKSDVRIKNTGDTDAYIRAEVVINWISSDATKVWAVKPNVNEYVIEWFAEDSNWFEGDDGYYYYKKPISPTHLTDKLIQRAYLADGITAPVYDGIQYYLSIEIIASAIQVNPNTAVTQYWGVTVANDGTIAK